jgi:CheY-like chemotaxis protein
MMSEVRYRPPRPDRRSSTTAAAGCDAGAARAVQVVGAPARQALDLAARQPPALVVLEMRQGRGDGVGLCRRLRELVGEVPVIFLAADAGDEAKVAGLRCGDDYVTKPFSLVELLARVQAVLRRARPAPSPAGPTFDDGLLLIDLDARRVRFGGVAVALTPTEFAPAGIWSSTAAGCCCTRTCSRASGATFCARTPTCCGCTSPTCARRSSRTQRSRATSGRCVVWATRSTPATASPPGQGARRKLDVAPPNLDRR